MVAVTDRGGAPAASDAGNHRGAIVVKLPRRRQPVPFLASRHVLEEV
jgi:hypothetical protein